MLYCVTVARGMQPFAVQQLTLHSCTIKNATEGKITFDCNNLCELNELRCVERLFAEITSIHIGAQSTTMINKRELFDQLFASCETSTIQLAFEKVLEFQHLPSSSVADELNFRVSIKTSGRWRRKIDTEKLSSSIARHLKKHSKWTTSLRGAVLFELCIHISNDNLFIGVPLLRVPLSVRPYLRGNALRSTICDAMLSLAAIQDGMFILDVTCGSCSILIQAAHEFPQKCFLLGCDINEDMLKLSMTNRDYLEECDRKTHLIELIAADVHLNYLRLDAVDRIISDIPFGQNYGNEQDSLRILKRIVDIFSRGSVLLMMMRTDNDGVQSGCSDLLWRARGIFLCSSKCEAILLIAASHQPMVSGLLTGRSRLLASYPLSLGTTQASLISLVNS